MIARDESPYHRELSAFRVAYSKAGSVTSMVLVLLGAGLDMAMYPQRFDEFLAARIGIAVLTLVIFVALYSATGRTWVRPLTLLWLALPQVMIAWMIGATNGVQSIYFVGLLLALYATGIVLPVTFLEGVSFGLFTYAVYLLACALNPDGLKDQGTFVGNSLFILFFVGASAVCTYFNEKARLQLFQLQREVAEKNATLVSTNEALAQIKGHMIQQEKMAALGTLSAGLMHEVNNPVNYSMMALNMAMLDPAVTQSADLKESLVDAKEGLARVQNIVSDLKTFAYQKPGEDSSRIFLLEKAVLSAQRLTGHELSGIDVQVNWPQDTHVRGDEPAVIGVLINLFSNAALALRKAQRAQPRIEVTGQHRDGRLYVTVRDNGTGIEPDNLTRVFEPFFTTRGVGQGLGLGLSVSYAIIQRHGGTLVVTSEAGVWTEFAFDLALADAAV
ncbi:MAG: two-component sensor histidine kinase [Burkholderiales bacterium]|nr:two-component sensor histidine kinase [Burkholderiales bacterium]